MSREQAATALPTGIEVIEDEVAQGLDLVATGEMGIGNTTPASAITAVYTGLPVAHVTGRGTGVDDVELVLFKVEERTMMESQGEYGIGVKVCQVGWGWIGFAWSERGLVRVTLPQPAEAGARRQLPRPRGTSQPSGLDVAAFVDKLRRYFSGEVVVFDEPLDPRVGTDFQRRVWSLTRTIPRGKTRSYGQLALEAGSPGAARAVGQAMARNPWPVVVPCHRVVGHAGGLTGFGGGLGMKERMLFMEGALKRRET
jgi:methylated-DNA-[protein]-cysteine S-methyltransferase